MNEEFEDSTEPEVTADNTAGDTEEVVNDNNDENTIDNLTDEEADAKLDDLVKEASDEDKEVSKENVSDKDLAELTTSGISIHTLTDKIDPSDEKSVLAALKHVEQISSEAEIFVEYL